MVFSSITFLYYFLPVLLFVYFLTPSRFKNIVLLFFSLLFYFYGESKNIWILLLSIIVNYFAGIFIEGGKWRGLVFVLTILFDIGMLFYFKYTYFFVENINNIFNSNISVGSIVMPIGISFFTFQVISYIIDVYRGRVKCSRNFLNFATYVSFFAQLIAGPIVRYVDIDKQLVSRDHSFDKFALGIERFVLGLGKKVLLANVLGEACSFIGNVNDISVLGSWLNAIFFTLQIYFDFSGYSDMAIGLGLMFGFSFLENFDYPYMARSVTEFWRRWHISLSFWFRDYVYIPLGGNRVNKLRWLFNIFIVWFLTGFWHGADWNFILWGVYFAIILLVEKLYLSKFLDNHKFFGHIYTLLVVIVGFLIFNNDINNFLFHFKNMFFLGNSSFANREIIYCFRNYFVLFVISIFACTPFIRYLFNKISFRYKDDVLGWLKVVYLLCVFLLCTAYLIDASFNPFLYFRF